jgi:hypothetical protein
MREERREKSKGNEQRRKRKKKFDTGRQNMKKAK